MTIRSSGNIFRLFLLLLMLTCIGKEVFSQTLVSSISGNIKNIRGANKYPHTAVSGITAANKMTVANASGFTIGDTVLVIQMKGVVIYLSPYGEYAGEYGQPGKWEFVIVSGVSGSEITFLNNLKNAYDIRGNIQIIRVPSFNSAKVTGKLDCDPWDPVTMSGGVLPLIVGNTLTLQANIDVSGLGFRGGAAVAGDGVCQSFNPPANQLFFYPAGFTNAGFKGEGIANYDEFGISLIPGHEKGKGILFTGGGGGNGAYSGGGGGSHRGAGGIGGNERSTCVPVGSGGKPGYAVQSQITLQNKIFMGGGGGGSTRSASGVTGPGGNGGGIVIIISNSLIGSGGSIIASGTDGGSGSGGASNPSGAGGGGAGGTIALSVLNYSGSINTDVRGGKGGDNTGRLYGEGGGGGAGLVWLTVDNTVNIVPLITGGQPGTSSNVLAAAGDDGEKLSGFNPNLNGFLFNSVRSAFTQTQADTSCSNMPPPKILGTLPIGDSYPDSVFWQRSTDKLFSTFTTVLKGKAIDDSSPLWDYTPVLSDTTVRSGKVYFRRYIRDSSLPTVLEDWSLPVEILIQPSIKRNYVGPPDTICFSQDPPAVGSTALITGGNNIYRYKWMVSTVNANSGFTSPSNNTNESYDPPPGLQLDSWYRRTVTSGRCIDSSGIVRIEVLDDISNNTISSAAAEEICNGMSFSPVTATIAPALTGGDGSYRYKWISSANTWDAAPDTYTSPGYNPVAASFALGTPVSIKRVVFSGNHDVCKDTTTSVVLTRWPVIINNTVTADQTIGYDSIPDPLIENPVPGMTGGSGVFSYQWQKDTLAWSPAPGTFNQSAYQAPALKVTTRFRRFVTSSACTSISNTITITVHKKITNTISLAIVANDTVATGSNPGQVTGSVPGGGSEIPGDYSYKWYRSTTGVFLPGDLIAGASSQSLDPGVLTSAGTITTYYFRRDVSSPIVNPTSTYKSNVIKVVVLPVLATYNITGSTPKCSGFRPDWLKGSAVVTGGDGKYKYTWQDSTGGHNFADIPGFVKCDSANYKPPVLTSGAAYRRIAYSGKNYTLLNATSNIVRVTVYPLPSGSLTTLADTTVCGGTSARVRITLTGATKFRVTMKENSSDLPEISDVNGPEYVFSIIKSPAAASEIYTYALSKVIDQHQCVTTSFPVQSRKVTVYKQPVSNAGADVTAWCGPVIRLDGSTPVNAGGGTWTWKKVQTTTGAGTAVFSNPNDPRTTVYVDSLSAAWENSNKYRFYWTDINGICSSRDSADITFNKRVPPVVIPQPLKYNYDNDGIDTLPLINTSVGTGVWEPVTMVKNGNIAYNLDKGVNLFTYVVTNEACQNSADYRIEVIEIRIPKGFSPNNGDASNNLFEITGIESTLPTNKVTLRIINSAGSEVFYADNDNWKFWDGTRNGVDAPEGTYYYLLTMASNIVPGSKQEWKGYLILKRRSYN